MSVLPGKYDQVLAWAYSCAIVKVARACDTVVTQALRDDTMEAIRIKSLH